MQLEEYFEFRDQGEIRIRGTRVGIEIVLTEYLSGRTAEEIALNYPALSPEQIHASITYYLHNRPAVDRYLAHWRALAPRRGRRRKRTCRRWWSASVRLPGSDGPAWSPALGTPLEQGPLPAGRKHAARGPGGRGAA